MKGRGMKTKPTHPPSTHQLTKPLSFSPHLSHLYSTPPRSTPSLRPAFLEPLPPLPQGYTFQSTFTSFASNHLVVNILGPFCRQGD